MEVPRRAAGQSPHLRMEASVKGDKPGPREVRKLLTSCLYLLYRKKITVKAFVPSLPSRGLHLHNELDQRRRFYFAPNELSL